MAIDSAFKVADLVQLKSGGPKMTVHKITPDGIDCVWFNSNNEPCRGVWFESTLIHVPRELEEDEAE